MAEPSTQPQPPGSGAGPQAGAAAGQSRPAPGRATKVPPSAGRDTATRAGPQIASAPAKKIVLVCDDVTQIRKILCFNLRAANYETIEAEDGAEAIKVSETQPVDCILLDVMTPRVDGFTACGRIKANPKTQHVPIIMLTACSQKEDVIKALSSGACDYILKPFKKETVLAKIERALSAPAAPAPGPSNGSAPPPSAAPGRS